MQTSNQTIRMSELPGIDLARGLITTQQNHGLYIRLMNKFYDKQQTFSLDFETALAQDVTDAERTAHSLKGNAGNLGMNQLFETAKALEFACKDNDQNAITVALKTVQDDLEIVLSSIETLNKGLVDNSEQSNTNSEITSSNTKTVDKVSLEPLLQEFYQLLTSNNIKSSSQLQKIKPLILNTEFAQAFTDIENHIDDYDFAEAADVLKTVSSALSISL
ncbi:MAG: Hpt domain-containing protein [Gammaproteobacteria bacterium]|nr:Hpt domain-containing protein [Gammaproteobacteria bacterium]